MVHEASLGGIIRILFWILVVSFIIRLVARLAIPYVVRGAQERMQEQMRNQQRAREDRRREGEVRVESNKGGKGRKEGGEYVDYVEIKED
ncbi:MAG: hypothetical protein ACKO7B_15725 [Flavobacteriales bacterium]